MRTVAAGHRMIAEGWEMFEEAVEAAGTGDLPQLLRSLREMTMPTPPPPQTPPPAGPVESQSTTAVPMEVTGVSGESLVKKQQGPSSEPIVVVVGGGKKMGLSTVFNCKGVEEWLPCPYQGGPNRKGSSLWPVWVFNLQFGFPLKAQEGT